jgi:4-hydroxybenzoate polyprenyltransferase
MVRRKKQTYKNFADLSAGPFAMLNSILTLLSISSIWIGITGFFVTYITHILLGLTPNFEICFVVFLVVFSVYSLNKFTDVKEDEINMPERTRFISRRKNIVLFSALGAYMLAIVLTVLVKPSALPVVFIPLVTNAIYGSKLIPWIPRLKDIPVMKNFVVALSWALVVVLFPAVGTIDILNGAILIIFYFVSVKYFINTVLFDIRDVKGDREMGIKTMPVILGVRKTLIILLGINSTLLLLIPFVPDGTKLLIAFMVLYGYVYTIHFRERRNPLQLDYFVDGEWVLASALYIFIITIL